MPLTTALCEHPEARDPQDMRPQVKPSMFHANDYGLAVKLNLTSSRTETAILASLL